MFPGAQAHRGRRTSECLEEKECYQLGKGKKQGEIVNGERAVNGNVTYRTDVYRNGYFLDCYVDFLKP